MFFYIGGLGRCGEVWLSKVLNRPDDRMVCYHNMISRLEKQHSVPASEVVEPVTVCPAYFVLFKELSRLAVAGDASSWPNFSLGYVLNELDAQKMVWLTRNGIVQVHAFDVWLDKVHEHSIQNHAGFVANFGTPVEVSSEWETLSQFQQLCWWWSIQQWVARRINDIWCGPVNMVCIEKLQDSVLFSLAPLLKWIDPLIHIDQDELYSWLGVAARPAKDSKAIWERWGADKRTIFKDVCGSTMEALGYEQHD